MKFSMKIGLRKHLTENISKIYTEILTATREAAPPRGSRFGDVALAFGLLKNWSKNQNTC